MMVADMDGLSFQDITFTGTGDKHDIVLDTKGQLPLIIHEGCNGQVGQGKKCPTLTDVSAIEVLASHCHSGNGMMFVHFSYLAAGIGCKTVGLIQ